METENKYRFSKAYYKILELIQSNPDENVFVIRGGQGAGKTISILQLIIQSLLSSEKEAAVLSSELSKMKRTVVRDYKKICKDWNVFQGDNDYNKSESKHDYPNESYLDFLGADVNDIGKGFRRDILYINEADRMDIETAVQFISRSALTIIDYNPDSLFWGDEYINGKNFITLTYEDNEYLSSSEIKSILDYKAKGFHDPELPFELLFKEDNIKSKYWANKWRVYGLGLVGSLSGVVFDNWEIIDGVPDEAKLLGRGLDFGYSNDPTALIDLYKMDDIPIYDERLFSTGLTNPDINERLESLGVNKREEMIADSVEPKSIEELRRMGWRIYACTKGRDSINNGIQVMQQKKFKVTRRSVNMITELEKYTWATDKTGAKTGKPIDDFNHTLDAARYISTEKLSMKPRASISTKTTYRR